MSEKNLYKQRAATLLLEMKKNWLAFCENFKKISPQCEYYTNSELLEAISDGRWTPEEVADYWDELEELEEEGEKNENA